jgi:phage terminase small subunit
MAARKNKRNSYADKKRQIAGRRMYGNVAGGGLSPKILDVLAHYFTNGYHQKEAMLSAGYAESTASTAQFQIFGRPDVKAEIERRLKELNAAAQVDADWLMRRLKIMIEASPGDILRKLAANDHDLNCLNDEELYALDEITEKNSTTLEYNQDTDSMERLPVKEIKIKLAGRNTAIVTAMRKLGLFKEVDADAVAGSIVERLNAARARTSGGK